MKRFASFFTLAPLSFGARIYNKPDLKQQQTTYTINYALQDNIAVGNVSFPGTVAPSSYGSPAMFDLQQGVASVWNCTGTAVCDNQGF
jgi:hypothetical protein